jgi:ATP-dependent Lon protease
MDVHETLPIVPLRDVVVFPHMMMPFVVGRPSSTRALEDALAKDKRIFLAAQHDAAVDDPQPADIYTMGCVANIVQSLKLPDGNIKVLVEGVDRARAVEWKEGKGFYRVVAKIVPKQRDAGADLEATMGRVVSLFEQYIKVSNNMNYDAMVSAVRVDDPGKLADTIAAHLLVGVDEKQKLLEMPSAVERLGLLTSMLERELTRLKERQAIPEGVDERVLKKVERLHATTQSLIDRLDSIMSLWQDLARLVLAESDMKGNRGSDEVGQYRQRVKEALAVLEARDQQRIREWLAELEAIIQKSKDQA